MAKTHTFSLVLNAHTPFVPHRELSHSIEEEWFFDSLSETYLPLLEMFDRLDADHIPFRLGLVLSPVLCYALQDDVLTHRYLEHLARQIEFGKAEQERAAGDPERLKLARLFCDNIKKRRTLYTERYDTRILDGFKYYQSRGNIELLITAATNAFLPFYTDYPESIQAQFETAIIAFRNIFGNHPYGFWLPELGWTKELDQYISTYHFAYTIVDTHGFILGNPPASRGIFYPVKTPSGTFVLGRDYDMPNFQQHDVYRDPTWDAGFELPSEQVIGFQGIDGARTQTGYKYYNRARGMYDPDAADHYAVNQAHDFLTGQLKRFEQIEAHMDERALDLYTLDADAFGRFWYEGPLFLETLFRELVFQDNICCATPVEYLFDQDVSGFQTAIPAFSSRVASGYAEPWLDASNDWLYRHLVRAIERMVELAERFPNAVGIKERTLNQAAREVLLAQNTDWPKMLYQQEYTEYAHNEIEGALRNFTTIYEALGGSYLNMEWLTDLERQHNIFPDINYRVFRRKIV